MLMSTWFNPLKQFIRYQTDATRKAAEIIEKSKVGTEINLIISSHKP